MTALPWLHRYDPGVPHSIGEYPNETLIDVVRRHAAATPGGTAILFKGRRLTFRDIEAASNALANALRGEGIGRGSRVAVILPNCPQFVICELAVWKLGGVLVPQNPLYTERELEESLRTTEPDTMIVLTPFYERVKQIQARTSVRRVIATNIKEYLPGLLRVLFTLAKEKKEGHRITIRDEDRWLQALIDIDSAPAPQSTAQPDDDAMILMSGGTTGIPKGVLVKHRDLVVASTQISAWNQEAFAAADSAVLLPLPLFHVYGSVVQAVSFMNGVPLILVPNPRDIGDVVKTIHRDRPAVIVGVPTLYSAITNHPKVIARKIDFSSLKTCTCGAAALLAETQKRFEELTGASILEGYSLTEAVMACCGNPYRGERRAGSVGLPYPDVRVRIFDSEEGVRELAMGEVGEIVMSAPQLMTGYWNNEEETRRTIRTLPDGSSGLFTGDLGYLDGDGYLFLVDRKKDVIKTSGYQVWPREVEEVIATHPDVFEVGVAGLPDERKGEIVAAWIVPRPGTAPDPATLREYCRGRLAAYKVPARIELRHELPKTLVGKILRRALVAEAKKVHVAV